jgi:hypothetical protein
VRLSIRSIVLGDNDPVVIADGISLGERVYSIQVSSDEDFILGEAGGDFPIPANHPVDLHASVIPTKLTVRRATSATTTVSFLLSHA